MKVNSKSEQRLIFLSIAKEQRTKRGMKREVCQKGRKERLAQKQTSSSTTPHKTVGARLPVRISAAVASSLMTEKLRKITIIRAKLPNVFGISTFTRVQLCMRLTAIINNTGVTPCSAKCECLLAPSGNGTSNRSSIRVNDRCKDLLFTTLKHLTLEEY